jgi:hypothetical protein
MAAGLVLAVVLAGWKSRSRTRPLPQDEPTESVAAADVRQQGHSPQTPEVRFPRRLLFIHISNYAFLNPLTAHAPGEGDRTKAWAQRLAQDLHVPTQSGCQAFVLSDTAALPDTQVATRGALMQTYERFLTSSGPSERIVVYFGGRALEVDGKAFLAPMEGDANNPKSLVPLADFYAKLKACRAVQKVVIWDVCRFNPERDRPRNTELMTPSLFKALTAAPPGVEVVTTCQPCEYALEFSLLHIDGSPGGSQYSGSAFLESIRPATPSASNGAKPQAPSDPIPVADWAAAIGKRVAEAAAKQQVQLKQTVRYYAAGDAAAPTVAAPDSAPAKSPSAEVSAIVEEFRVPLLTNDRPPIALTEYPFRPQVLASYKSTLSLDEIRKNKQKYPFQNATLNAFQTIRDVWVFKAKGGLQRREVVAPPITDALKREIKKELDGWGIGIAKLEEADRTLDQVARLKNDQPKRWQAHYDYARAVLKARLAFMNEYDKLLGDVLTETLPPLEKSLKQDGYRLVPSEKLKSKKDVQKIAEEAQEAYAAVIADYKQTPWAIVAEFEKRIPIGLVWQPHSIKK